MQLDAGLVDLDDEHAEPTVLGHVPVRAQQTQAVVGEPRARRPDLGAVHDPLVAVAHRGRQRAGHVRATTGLGQELHPDLLALEDRRDVPLLLLLGAELEQHRRAGHERRHLEDPGDGVARRTPG